jgi:hypothetical protein
MLKNDTNISIGKSKTGSYPALSEKQQFMYWSSLLFLNNLLLV